MRIISGKFGGRRFDFRLPPETRPTTDFVRESVFNILRNFIELENKIVYDLYAGTGAYGFESISRGADFCCFVDINIKSCEIIKKVSEKLNLSDKQILILKKDVLNFLKKFSEYLLPEPDIIFIDAPYEKRLENLVLEAIRTNNVYKKNSIIIVEHSKMLKVIPPHGFELINTKETGDTIIDFINCKL